MYAEAPDVPAGKILDVPIQRLNSLRRSAFKDILTKAGQVPDLIVNTHATFRWRHGLFPAVDFDQMRQLKADLYICLIDGIAALHHRLLAEHTAEHTLKDLIVWREEEIIGTEMLRKGIDDKVPLYCLARGASQDTTETFYKLVFESKVRKTYLSFPMTAVVGLDDVQREIALFRRQMKSLFICFDPGDLEESDLPHRARLAQSHGQDHVPVDIGGRSVRLSTRQIQEIERDINSQTYARDFMLIDQSDMIVSFIPILPDGRAAISSGVERELQHAHEAAKEVYVIWPARQSPSVFVTQTATQMFKTLHEAMDFLARKGYVKP
jgi:adenylate kinase